MRHRDFVNSSLQAPVDFRPLGCRECRDGLDLGFAFSMAFQPIVNVVERRVYAHEALVRGIQGEPAGTVLAHVDASNRYRFDQSCRVKAVELASRLGCQTRLSINFMPNAIYRPELCIRTTLEAAKVWGFPTEDIIFEFTEDEELQDPAHLKAIVQEYRRHGFQVAIDDFGAGFARFDLLADAEVSIVKLDMALIRNLDQAQSARRRSMVRHMVGMIREVGALVIAEGIESDGEVQALRDLGVELMQGYRFARPSFEALSVPAWA